MSSERHDRDVPAGVRRLFRLPLRTAAHARADADEELESFIDARIEELVARGASPAEARTEALSRLGGGATVAEVRATLYRSAERREWHARFHETTHRLRQDARFAVRQLARSPGFTTVAALTLALGIGATTAIFSAVNPVLFEPLPYPHAERIVMVSDVAADGSPLDVTFGTFRELAARSRSFDALAVAKPWRPAVTAAASEPERLDGQRVSADYFRVLGVRPRLGRDFDGADDRPNGPRVVVLGDGLWRRRFGGDPSVVGRVVMLDDNPTMVIGVMPPTFENVLAPTAAVWAPLQYGATFAPDSREWGHHLRMVGRLRGGVGVERAARELAAIAGAPAPEFARVPWASLSDGLLVGSLQESVTRGVRPALLAVLGAVLLVLVIACVNVTNLALARGAQRRGEFAVRVALGAGRGRLVRQLLTESVLLAALGGALGIAVAAAGVRALVALSPAGLPRLGAIRLDGAALAFALAVTTVTGLAVGLIPALQASRAALRAGLERGARRAAGGERQRLTRGSLVVAEVALALVLLVSAGLLLRSLERLFAVNVGFDAAPLLTMQVQTSGHRLDSDSARVRFYERTLDAVRAVPGVAAAAFTSLLPQSGDVDSYGVHFESDDARGDAAAADDGGDGAALRYAVTPDYFAAMRIPLRRGRLLDARDAAGAPRAAVIDESLARRKFPGRDPVGQRLRFGSAEGDWYTVVGVVGDVRQASVGPVQTEAIYVTPAQWHWVDNLMALVVRAGAGHDAAALAPAVRRAIWSVDRDQPIVRVATMRELVRRSAAERRFALVLFEAFGVAALLLSAIGIYGVLAGTVAERTREIGVRAALGATRADIVGMVVRQAMGLTALGVVIGVSGAAGASRAIATLLFGVSPLDLVTYAGVVGLLVVVSAVACWVPAWRAARVDPATALRAT